MSTPAVTTPPGTTHALATDSRTWQYLLQILIRNVLSTQFLETTRASSIVTTQVGLMNAASDRMVTGDKSLPTPSPTTGFNATTDSDYRWKGLKGISADINTMLKDNNYKEYIPVKQQYYNTIQLAGASEQAKIQAAIDQANQGNQSIDSTIKTVLDMLQSLISIGQASQKQ